MHSPQTREGRLGRNATLIGSLQHLHLITRQTEAKTTVRPSVSVHEPTRLNCQTPRPGPPGGGEGKRMRRDLGWLAPPAAARLAARIGANKSALIISCSTAARCGTTCPLHGYRWRIAGVPNQAARTSSKRKGIISAFGTLRPPATNQTKNLDLLHTRSDAGVPGIRALPRELFQAISHHETGDKFHVLVAELAGDTEAERTAVAHRKLASIHPVG